MEEDEVNPYEKIPPKKEEVLKKKHLILLPCKHSVERVMEKRGEEWKCTNLEDIEFHLSTCPDNPLQNA